MTDSIASEGGDFGRSDKTPCEMNDFMEENGDLFPNGLFPNQIEEFKKRNMAHKNDIWQR